MSAAAVKAAGSLPKATVLISGVASMIIGVVALPLVVAVGAVSGTGAGLSGGSAMFSGPASSLAQSQIPPSILPIYRSAAAAACGLLPWQLLAGIGWIESGHGQGRVDPTTGEVAPPILGPALNGLGGTELLIDHSFSDGYAHAEGPMQFLPSTWSAIGTLAPGRPAGALPDPENAWDAIYSAARMLCADGADKGNLQTAVLAYNHSQSYLNSVWQTAISYGMSVDTSPVNPGPVQGLPGAQTIAPGNVYQGDPAVVVTFAQTQLGVPYVWGGTTAGRALDCSGLVYLAYEAAGVRLPRTTFSQVDYGLTVPTSALLPGDLLFFRSDDPPENYGHVAIYIGDGLMIHARYTGTVVQVAAVPMSSVEVAKRILVSS